MGDDDPQVLEALTEAVYIIEADGRIQFCNAALAQLTGYAARTLLGRPSLGLYAPEDQPAVLDRRTRAFRGEPVLSLLEATLVRHDGARLPVELSLSSLMRGGQVVARVTVVRDVSARKQAEAALHASEERFRLLVEGVHDYAIYLLDPEGHVITWNTGAERIKGYTAAEILGEPFSRFFPTDKQARGTPAALLEQTARDGHYVGEGWRVRQDGSQFWASVVITALRDAHGQLRGFAKVTRDITERQRSAQRLATQYAITRILAESDTLADATPPLLQAIGESMAWEWGALWDIDRDAGVLRCQHIWHAPHLAAEEFDAISRATAGLPGPGLKGRVWQSPEPTWIAEATQDPHFVRAPIAARVGLHGAVAFPILLNDETIGILEFFSGTVRPPDEEDRVTLATIGSQIGQFVERKRVEAEQRKLASLVEHSPDFIGIASPEGQVLFVNPAGQRLLGLEGEAHVRTTGLLNYVVEHDRARVQEHVLPAVLREGHWEGEVRCRHVQTGAAIPMLHHIFSIQEPGSDHRLALATISRDITERKQAEETLRAANERVAMILASITDQFFAIDKDWRYTYLNPQAAEQMKVQGKDPARLIGNVLWEEFPNPTSGEHLRRAMSERVVVTDEQYDPPLGEWYENRIYPSPDGGIAVFQRYVTDRKRAEEELRRANARITEILESITDAFSAWDQNWRYIYVNERAVQLLGKPRGELIGRCVWDLFPNAVGTEAYLKCQQAMTERVPLSFEAFFPVLNRWYENDVYPTKEGLSVYWRDITERKREEEQLRRSEACLVDAQRLSHTGSWAWNVSTGALFWSQEHFRICGLDPEGVTPSYPAALACIHPEDRSVVQQALERAVRDRREFDQECRIVRPDGMLRHIRSVANPVFDAAGELTEYVGTIIDITERKQAEAEVHRAYEGLEQQVRERTAALARANVELRAEIAERCRTEAALAQRNEELLGLYDRVEQERALQATLLRELNHRVRNNLAAILGILEVERGRAPRRTADEALAACAARLTAIARVHDLLAAGAFAPMDLRDFIAVVAGGIMPPPEAGAPQIALVYDEASLTLPAKPFLALACITNELIVNAVKHAFPGRAHGRIEVRAWGEGERYVLEVRDDGVGFAAGADAAGTGLEIVAALCTTDLRGYCRFLQDGDTIARITFPKAVAAAGAEP